LVAAAGLAAGLHGIENGIEPPPPSDEDVYARARDEVEGLPTSLAEATELLTTSEVARSWLGNELVDHYCALRRAEVEAAAWTPTDWEIRRYLEAF
jgi:glutamine synthetase